MSDIVNVLHILGRVSHFVLWAAGLVLVTGWQTGWLQIRRTPKPDNRREARMTFTKDGIEHEFIGYTREIRETK
ncbi:MAG: hypothetical protein JWP74_1742 [Marmoricola sp.]|nr:hypothetical protein [Marmoricola sp.]